MFVSDHPMFLKALVKGLAQSFLIKDVSILSFAILGIEIHPMNAIKGPSWSVVTTIRNQAANI